MSTTNREWFLEQENERLLRRVNALEAQILRLEKLHRSLYELYTQTSNTLHRMYEAKEEDHAEAVR